MRHCLAMIVAASSGVIVGSMRRLSTTSRSFLPRVMYSSCGGRTATLPSPNMTPMQMERSPLARRTEARTTPYFIFCPSGTYSEQLMTLMLHVPSSSTNRSLIAGWMMG